MIWQKVQSWLGIRPPILALTLVNQELRYVVRQGERMLSQGVCSVPQAFYQGRLVAPQVLAHALLPLLPQVKAGGGRVAVLLPSQWLQLHEVGLLMGLDDEELAYQMNRYVTHTLGLNPTEVFFDWAVQSESAEKRVIKVLLAVARQADVAVFNQLFVDSTWRLQWVCPEPQVLGRAYCTHALDERPVAVCRVEPDGVAFFLIEVDGRVRSFYHALTDQESAHVGFVYHSGDDAPIESGVRFPSRFVGDLLEQHVSSWLGQHVWRDLNGVYVTGKAVNWAEAISLLQARFGVPFRLAEDHVAAAGYVAPLVVTPGNGLAAVWLLAGQVDA